MLADFRHPRDIQCGISMSKNRTVQALLNGFHSLYAEVTSFAEIKDRNFLITARTDPRVCSLLRKAAERLEVSEEIPLYAEFSYDLTAKTVGTDGDCAILISTACLEQFDDKQLLALLGHELGYIKYQQVKYLNIDKFLDTLLPKIPFIGSAAAQGVKALFLTWRQAVEYTADRAAAIAAQDAEPVMCNLLQGMGAGFCCFGSSFQYKTFLKEKAAPEQELTPIGSLVFQSMLDEIAVPFGTLRLNELQSWLASEQCREDFSFVYYGSASQFDLERYRDGGTLYEQAKQVINQNRPKGMAMLHAAARVNEPRAMSMLGRFYLRGKHELTQNDSVGLSYLWEAARLGEPSAQLAFGICLESGVGILLKRDLETAEWLFRWTAGLGMELAEQRLKGRPAPPVISEAEITETLDWIGSHFLPGEACTVDQSRPVRGLDFAAFPEAGSLHRYLWLPADEPVYAVEVLREQEESLSRAAAVCGAGIYLRRAQDFPRFISWQKLKKGTLSGREKRGGMELSLDGVRLLDYQPQSLEYSAARILIHAKAVLEKNNTGKTGRFYK